MRRPLLLHNPFVLENLSRTGVCFRSIAPVRNDPNGRATSVLNKGRPDPWHSPLRSSKYTRHSWVIEPRRTVIPLERVTDSCGRRLTLDRRRRVREHRRPSTLSEPSSATSDLGHKPTLDTVPRQSHCHSRPSGRTRSPSRCAVRRKTR